MAILTRNRTCSVLFYQHCTCISATLMFLTISPEVFESTTEPAIDSSESTDQTSSQTMTDVQGGGPGNSDTILQSMGFKIGIGVGGAFLAFTAVVAVVVVLCAVWQCRDRKELPISEVYK